MAQTLTIVTMVIGKDYRKGLEIALDSKKTYAAKHGYTYIEGGDTFWNRERPIAWSKIPFLLDILSKLKDGDLVWLSDADVLITNPEISFMDTVLPLLPANKDLLMTLDSCGHLNSGNLVLRNTEWQRAYWKKVWEQTDCIYHIWWENAGMIKVMETDEVARNKIEVTKEHKKFNAFLRGIPGEPLWEPGDFLVHFAGVYDPKEIQDLIQRIQKGEVPRLKM
jgi:hypothetical protein